MKNKFFKQLFCRHKINELICWHWTHGQMSSEPRFIEMQLKCKKCNKYRVMHIKNYDECVEFANKYKNKEIPFHGERKC